MDWIILSEILNKFIMLSKLKEGILNTKKIEKTDQPFYAS